MLVEVNKLRARFAEELGKDHVLDESVLLKVSLAFELAVNRTLCPDRKRRRNNVANLVRKTERKEN